MTVCMFSLSGLPPTAGFMSKFYIFKTAIESGHTGIALTGIVTSIVSVYYYLRVVYFMFMKDASDTTPATIGGVFATGALAISVLGIIGFGLFPTPLFNVAGQAAQALFP
jgi:NADH-quinone oxidoreductase subunit N